MSKFNMDKIITSLKKDLDESRAKKIGTGSNLHTATPEDFLKMPEWWTKATNTLGLPYGRMVMLAGDSDSGKTSAAIAAMKAAQAQECAVIYVETENKTTEDDLVAWGVDPTQIILIKSSVIEEAYMLLFEAWEGFRKAYPKDRLLVVFDSIGNVVSQRDATLDLIEENGQPGGKGKTNRTGLGRIVVKLENEPQVAVLIINYTYDNIGSPGKTNAGGKAINFYSSLTYQTARKRWLEKGPKDNPIRVGAEVSWTLFKNHIDKKNPGPKKVLLQITAEGISYVGAE